MKDMFNIYYINSEKASEISMLFDNKIVEKVVKIKNSDSEIRGSGNADIEWASKIPFLRKCIPKVNLELGLRHSRLNQVEDTIKVVSSKSIILKTIYEHAKEESLEKCKIGNLIKIKNVHLSVENLKDVMATKALMSGLVSQVPIQGMGNINFTSLMEVAFKDSAYILSGEVDGLETKIMLKIPMSAENEMESQYSLSDIEIGKVTVLGIYRGKYEKRDIERKVNRLMVLNDSRGQTKKQEKEEKYDAGDIEDGIQNSEKITSVQNAEDSETNKAHYIDVIAVVQDVNV